MKLNYIPSREKVWYTMYTSYNPCQQRQLRRSLAFAHHTQLAFLLQKTGEGEGGEDAGCQRAVGVDGSSVLGIPMIRNG